MGLYFNGFTIPEKVQEGKDTSCLNSYCATVDCIDCINFPLFGRTVVKQDYLMEINRDAIVSEDIERLPDGD